MAFKNLGKARADGLNTFEFDTLDLGAGAPKLTVRYGGKGTPGFRSDEVRLANASKQRGDKVTEHGIAENLADDAKLIARHCVAGWLNVVEDDGAVAPCTPEKVEEFLLTLIDQREDLFLGFRRFVRNAENFVGAAAISKGYELGKS